VTDDVDTENENKLILQVEDDMIVKFCELNGGMEFAMPIIRNQYEKLNIDFKNPSKEDLRRIADRLVEVTENIKGEIVAREEKKVFKDLLSKLDQKK
jgi:hypothetical protein